MDILDFTEKELYLLKLAFKLVDEVVEMQQEWPLYTDMRNDLYCLQNKLGIYDLIEGY
mgnify:CR=1 FL=1